MKTPEDNLVYDLGKYQIITSKFNKTERINRSNLSYPSRKPVINNQVPLKIRSGKPLSKMTDSLVQYIFRDKKFNKIVIM